MEIYSVTKEDLSIAATSGKSLILSKLLNDKIITQEQYEKYEMNFAVIGAKPSFFSTMWQKLMGDVKNQDTAKYILVENISLKKEHFKDEEKK
jgi:hypothetical protein